MSNHCATSPRQNGKTPNRRLQYSSDNKSGADSVPPLTSAEQVDKLRFLLGTWNAADTYEKSVFAPNGGSGSGMYKTIPGPGGFSLLTDYTYEGPQGESSGHQLITWDPKQERYVGCGVTSRSPGLVLLSGQWEQETLVLVGEFDFRGMNVVFRLLFSEITNRAMVSRQYNSVDGSPPQLFGTTRFTRM